MSRRELARLARERVAEDYAIVGRGNIGEPSNGALLLRMAAALDPWWVRLINRNKPLTRGFVPSLHR